jgi:hypothetical protein
MIADIVYVRRVGRSMIVIVVMLGAVGVKVDSPHS